MPSSAGYEGFPPGNPRQSDVYMTGDQMVDELSTIMPVIASVMMSEISAASCTFYIYDPHQTGTIAVFRHGESQLLFPDPLDADNLDPHDVPIEAEVLRVQQSVRRSTADDFARFPLVNPTLRASASGYTDMAVPLMHHDHVYGVAYLWRSTGGLPFSDHEAVSAENLGSVGALAVELALQYRSERSRRRRLNALVNVATLAASPFSVAQIMQETAAIVRTMTEADVCKMYVFDETGDSVSDSYVSGLNDDEQWIFANSHCYAVSDVPAELAASTSLAPVIVRDPHRQLAQNSELVHYAIDNDISEILVVPVVYRRTMIGVIYLWYRDRKRRFEADAMSTIQAIANQAGGVIRQARLYRDTQRHISDTEALRRIGDSVLNRDSLEEVLDELANVLHQLIPHDYCFVGQIDEEADSVVVSHMWGDFPPEVRGYRFSLHDSLTGQVARTGQMANMTDHNLHARTHRYPHEHLPIYSVLISPLITENGRIGVLYIGRKELEPFTNRDERLMALFSHHAAAAIERTQAREALLLNARRQTFLAELTTTLITAEEPTEILQSLAERSVGVLADSVLIGLTTWRYGEIEWHGCASADPTDQEHTREALNTGAFDVGPERTEYLASADHPTLVNLKDGLPVDGRQVSGLTGDLFRMIGARQILTVPMRQLGRAPGMIILLSSDPDRHLDDPEFQSMAVIAANRIGDALERRQMVRNREALLRFSEAINAHTELDALLEMFVSELHDLLPYDQLYLGRNDQDTGETQPLIFVNPHGLNLEQVTLASNEGISGEVMTTRKAVIDNHAHLRPSSAYGTEFEAEFYAARGESAMAAPLIADNDVIGVVFIGRSGTNRFSESDFETFLLFSGLIASAIHRTQLLSHNQEMYRASVEVLAAVVDAKDPNTLEHSRHVAWYSRRLAIAAEIVPAMVERIELAGLLHDIGKISIPDHVLQKPGPLTVQERALINTHPERGERILSQHPALMNLTPLVRHHHERVDGTGYPDGLKGDHIPLGASIISVADAFDTMTSERAYHRRKSVGEALAELERHAGKQFDATLVQLFVELIESDPDVVRLGPEKGER
jgi:HD-GYP domain-containing protein (c-di-GMP phosphodiesterase class II)